MNPWALLAGLLAYNYRRHLHGRPTICSTTRRYVPAPVAGALLCAGFGWLLPHVIRGYPKEFS